MCEFEVAYPQSANLDPNKRVRYSNGLVLGVDELEQEQLYFLTRHRSHNRSLHGYGTVCGLDVSQREGDRGTELLVGPGLAVDPRGREIRVPEAHCAVVDRWLADHRGEVEAILDSTGGDELPSVTLYLVLCHEEYRTDRVPIPGGPCRTEEETSAPSRITDGFCLDLQTSAPNQAEEAAVEQFFDLLDSIEISDAPGGLTERQMEDLVAGLPDGEEPGDISLHMEPSRVRSLLRVAARVWVTRVRPGLSGTEPACVGEPLPEACVLLAGVDVPVLRTELGYRLDGDLAIRQQERPLLLHTRLLQRLLVHRPVPPPVDRRRSLLLPASLAARVGGPAGFIAAAMRYSIPAVRVRQGGELAFMLTVPADLDPEEPVRVRLLWTFQIEGAGDPVRHLWTLSSHLVAPEFSRVSLLNTEVSLTTARQVEPIREGDVRFDLAGREHRDRLRHSEFELTETPAPGHIGSIHVHMSDSVPDSVTYYLFQAEIRYSGRTLR